MARIKGSEYERKPESVAFEQRLLALVGSLEENHRTLNNITLQVMLAEHIDSNDFGKRIRMLGRVNYYLNRLERVGFVGVERKKVVDRDNKLRSANVYSVVVEV